MSEIAILFSRQVGDYGNQIMEHLDAKGIPYRNEHESQDLVSEPAARLIIDYLACLYRQREPSGWSRLMEQLFIFDDDDGESAVQSEFEALYATHLKQVKASRSEDPYAGWWDMTMTFLKEVGLPVLTALSPDYEAKVRLNEVVKQTRQQLDQLLQEDPNLLRALDRFSNDQAIRLLTIHKSKGLEFHSVIMPAIETQTFWGKAYEERCAFFVGVSRAKERLMITTCDVRFRPTTNPPRWSERRTPHAEFVSYITPFLPGGPFSIGIGRYQA
ncbi:DNA-dependent helicase II [compost metagenome]